MFESIKHTKVMMLDLDGTVYLDGELIGDAKNTLNYLRDKGITLVYLTNNSSRTDDAYYERLKNIGIWDDRDVFYSSLDAAIDYLKMNCPNATVYPVATQAVVDHLNEEGIKTGESADIVLLTYDTELNYKKLVKANELIVRGAKYIATHPDVTCPAKGVFVPDTGSFIELLNASSGRRPDLIVGKPYKIMAEMLAKKLGVAPNMITMVGDRLNTDIAFGVNNSLNTILVLSGETNFDMARQSQIKSDAILNDINEINTLI